MKSGTVKQENWTRCLSRCKWISCWGRSKGTWAWPVYRSAAVTLPKQEDTRGPIQIQAPLTSACQGHGSFPESVARKLVHPVITQHLLQKAININIHQNKSIYLHFPMESSRKSSSHFKNRVICVFPRGKFEKPYFNSNPQVPKLESLTADWPTMFCLLDIAAGNFTLVSLIYHFQSGVFAWLILKSL